jgi:hypothetical protein
MVHSTTAVGRVLDAFNIALEATAIDESEIATELDTARAEQIGDYLRGLAAMVTRAGDLIEPVDEAVEAYIGYETRVVRALPGALHLVESALLNVAAILSAIDDQDGDDDA